MAYVLLGLARFAEDDVLKVHPCVAGDRISLLFQMEQHVYTMLCFSTYRLMDTWLTSTSCSLEWVQKYLSASLLSIVSVELLGHGIIICLIFLGNCHPASLSHQERTYVKVQFLRILANTSPSAAW